MPLESSAIFCSHLRNVERLSSGTAQGEPIDSSSELTSNYKVQIEETNDARFATSVGAVCSSLRIHKVQTDFKSSEPYLKPCKGK